MHHHIVTLLLVTLFLLSFGHTIILAAAANSFDIQEGNTGPDVAIPKHMHIHLSPANADSNLLQLQSLQFVPGTSLSGGANQAADGINSGSSPSSSIVETKAEHSSPPTTAASPIIVTRIAATKTSEQSEGYKDSPETSFDHYHILGTRAGSPDSTLEKRRVCPVYVRFLLGRK